MNEFEKSMEETFDIEVVKEEPIEKFKEAKKKADLDHKENCLLYTSPSPRD